MIAWIVIITAISPFLASRSLILFYGFVAFMCAVLLAICFAKGEPPRWRWGNE